MKAARAVKGVLSLTKQIGQTVDKVRRELRARPPHRARGMDFNRAYRKLPTNATTRAGIEIAPDAAGIDGDFGFQPDCHPIARVIGAILSGLGAHRQNLANVVDDSLCKEKTGRELQIGTRRAHGY